MKTEFELQDNGSVEIYRLKIIGKEPICKPYVSLSSGHNPIAFIKDEDLERFAVNILKAINSKHIKK